MSRLVGAGLLACLLLGCSDVHEVSLGSPPSKSGDRDAMTEVHDAGHEKARDASMERRDGETDDTAHPAEPGEDGDDKPIVDAGDGNEGKGP